MCPLSCSPPRRRPSTGVPGYPAPRSTVPVADVHVRGAPRPPDPAQLASLPAADRASHLKNGAGDVDAAWAGLHAVEDRSASPHPVGLRHDLESLLVRLVTRVEDEAMRVHDRGRPDVVRIGPKRGTRARTWLFYTSPRP